MMSNLIVALNDLTCFRGDRFLFEQVNANISKGDLWQILGANGSGKTSVLRLLLGLLKPFSGTIVWNGDPSKIYLGHHNAVKNELTVFENLRYQFLIPPELLKEYDVVLNELGLLPYVHTLCQHLSQGQRQKVALARLWFLPASVWLLDEPFTALDHSSIVLLEQFFLKKLHEGVTIITTTHRDFSAPALKTLVKVLSLTS